MKELGVFDLPFLFGNEEVDAVLDGSAGAYQQKLEDAGLINLAYWENGSAI